MKRVLYVSSESSLGGASQSLCDMLVELSEYVRPIVVIPGLGDLENRLNDMHIKVYKVPLSRGFGKIGQHTLRDEERDFVINYKAAIEIKKIIENESIELLHINSSVCNAGAIGALLAGIPFVWHMREVLWEHAGCEFWEPDFKRALFSKANRCIAISKCVQNAYFYKYAINSQIIYDGIDAERYIQNMEDVRQDNHNFLVAGNVSEGKGQLEIIKAIRILKEKGIEDIRLYIVGGYSIRFEWCLKKYIKKYGLKDNIFLYQFVNDLSELRKKCLYAVVSSRFEALGRVTVEAMMAGNILIGANTAGTLELIGKSKKRGYLFMQGDSEALALTMLEAIGDDESVKKKIQENAQLFAINTFNVSNYAAKIYNVYEQVWSEGSTRDEDFIQYMYKKYVYSIEKNFEGENRNWAKREAISNLEKELERNEEGIKKFLEHWNIKSVAIYGMGRIGCKLYDLLEHLQFTISYVIDREPYFINEILSVFSPEDEVPSTDAIIITAIDDESKIKEKYLNKGNLIVWNIDEVIRAR